MDQGFIVLWRKLSDWEWSSDPPVLCLFVHLLLLATHKDIRHAGDILKRGEYHSSFRQLAKKTGLSVRQIRTAIHKLTKTGEITTREATQPGTVITICNYNLYQHKEEAERHKQRQTSDTPATQEQQHNKGKDKSLPNKRKFDPLGFRPLFIDEKNWDDLVVHRKAMKNPQTERAYTGLINEIQKAIDAGHNLNHIIDTYCGTTWKGFKAEYMNNHQDRGNNNGNGRTEKQRDDENRSTIAKYLNDKRRSGDSIYMDNDLQRSEAGPGRNREPDNYLLPSND